jgi:hypothetical protein
MNFFDQLISGLFPQKGNTSKALVHEVIKRNEREKQAFKQWKDSGKADERLRQLLKDWSYTRLDIPSEWDITLHESPYSNGFALRFPENMTKEEFIFLFDYLKERVLLLPYRPSGSDRKIIQNANKIETREKHYLKPNPGMDPKKANQRYGNIQIDLLMENDQPTYLRFICNIYQDSLFTKAGDFQELIHKVLGVAPSTESE